MLEQYRFSGRITFGFIPLLIVAAVVVAAASAVYAVLVYYNPLVYVGMLIVMSMGFLLSFCVQKAALIGKMRNMPLYGLSLLLLFGLFVYVHFASYATVIGCQFFMDEPKIFDAELFLQMLLHPIDMVLPVIKQVVELGVWSLNKTDTAIRGGFLLALWGVEHAAILGIAWMGMRTFMHRPFDETTGNWANKFSILDQAATGTRIVALSKEEQAQLKDELARGNLQYLANLKFEAATPGTQHFCEIEYYTDEKANSDLYFLNFSDIKKTVDKRRRTTKNETNFIRNLVAHKSDIDTIAAILNEGSSKFAAQLAAETATLAAQ